MKACQRMLDVTVDSAFITELVRQKSEPQKLLQSFYRRAMTPQWFQKANTETTLNRPYSRRILWNTPECEIMLARWSPQTSCWPHDHGASEGWVFYIHGNFEEQTFVRRDAALVRLATHSYQENSWTKVQPGEIHSCVAPGGGLSLHIYFPRISSMQVYDCARQKVITVTDDCGAWAPEPSQVVRERDWDPS